MPSITVQIPRPAEQKQQSLALHPPQHHQDASWRGEKSSSSAAPLSISVQVTSQQPKARAVSAGGSVVVSQPGQRRSIRVDCSHIAANLAAASSGAARRQRRMVRGDSGSDFEDLSGYIVIAKGVIIVDCSAAHLLNSKMNCAGMWRKLRSPPARKSGTGHAGLKRSKSAPRRCRECDKPLVTGGFFMRDDNFYCSADYQQLFGTRCQGCGDFVEGDVVVALDKTYHQRCFICHCCGKCFPPGESVTMQGDECVCESCFNMASEQNGRRCAGCDEEIRSGQALLALNQQWHTWCFRCQHCGDPLSAEYMGKDGQPYCELDYQTLFGVKCASCNCFITGRVLQAGENFYHPHCSQCVKCGGSFGEGEDMYIMRNDVWHPECGHLPNLSDISESPSLRFDCSEGSGRDDSEAADKPASPISLSSASSPEPSPASQSASELSRATRLGSRRSMGEASDHSGGTTPNNKLFDWRSRYSVDSGVINTSSADSPALNEQRRQSLASGVSSLSSSQGFRMSSSTSGTKLPSSVSTDEGFDLGPGKWHRSSLGSESRRRRSREFSDAESLPTPITEVFPLEVLQGVESLRLPKNVDRTRLEEYLSDGDFVKTFDMQRGEFKRLQVWKRREMKKRARLF